MSVFRSLLMANAAVDPLTVPLTFTAEEAASRVELVPTGLTLSGMHYRMGNSGLWMPYTAGTVLTLQNVGDSCQFWNSEDRLGTAYNTNLRIRITGRVSASGNIQSLLNWRTDCPDRSFQYMFQSQSGLSDVSKLLLPATSVGAYSYQYMLVGCSSNTAPTLPNITYYGTGGMAYMFVSSRVTSMRVGFTSWGDSANPFFKDWLSGVPSTGTFYKPSALPEEYGASRIPEGWTVVNID
jgi:hypothetical protein